jgi:hypothetical protein
MCRRLLLLFYVPPVLDNAVEEGHKLILFVFCEDRKTPGLKRVLPILNHLGTGKAIHSELNFELPMIAFTGRAPDKTVGFQL